MFDIKKEQPHAPGGRELLGKVLVGLSVGIIVAILMFIVLSFVSSIFMKASGINAETSIHSNPLLSFVCLFIGFLSSFIGNMLQVLAYNLFYSEKYYNISKVFGLLLLTNSIILVLVGPIYFLFSIELVTLFIILAFHVLLSIFVSMNVIEFSLSPNYANSSLVGNTLGFGLVMLIYAIFWKTYSTGSVVDKSWITLSIVLPPILGYMFMPLGLGIWEKIYLKFYEMGNNPFYIESEPDTGEEDQSNEEEINIDLD